ncbi:MAG: hypothetical protein PHV42_04615 [Candidatus Pacebacteria bacterium]|nr:hypothetical protein [Candidatus Paceibacterota bacterium]
MKSFKLESLSVKLPFLNVNFKIADDIEKEIINEILIRAADKRFLTSWQCCSSCTQHAIDSVLEYRKFLIDQKVKLSKIKKSQFIKIVDYLLEEIRKFLSISEKCDVHRDQKHLSIQLETLRNNVLNALYKFCNDTKIDYPKDLFAMMKNKNF